MIASFVYPTDKAAIAEAMKVGLHRADMDIAIFAPDGAPQAIGRVPGDESMGGNGAGMPMVFGRKLHMDRAATGYGYPRLLGSVGPGHGGAGRAWSPSRAGGA